MMKTRLVVILFLSLLIPEVLADEISPGIYRTPESRFENLKDFPYQPNYKQIGKYRIHYIDEGSRDAAPILLIHGEPTWSYLFRKMIPILTAAGHRVVAPDLVGFGKSDKPANKDDYSYQMQVDVMNELVKQLDLRDATAFGQDWGGLINLRVVAAQPDRFARVVVSNTALPSASGVQGWIGYPLFKLAVWREGAMTFEELQANITFPRWVAYSYHVEELPIGNVMSFLGGGESVRAAYEAPFPDVRYKAGAQIMPYLVPSQLRVNEEAWAVFESWNKPFLVAFTDSDPITRGGEQTFIRRVPGAINVTISGAGHFVQEDAGPELARMMNAFIAGEEVESVSVESNPVNTGDPKSTRGNDNNASGSELSSTRQSEEYMKVKNSVRPNESQMAGFTEAGHDKPIYMVNLLKFKEKAEYEDGRETNLSGEEAYGIYTAGVSELLREFGGKPVFAGDVERLMLGEVEDLWDKVAIAMYPSRKAMLDMMMSEKMPEIGVHRAAGLAGQLNIETVIPEGNTFE